MKNIAIFASGSGTNAERICRYFKDSSEVAISLILSNNADAGVLERARKLDVAHAVFSREAFYKTDQILEQLVALKIDLIVLAGFLWLIPSNLLKAFPNRIINIHPALLPDYGGKGMYGRHVHEAVIAAGERQSGITIHFVNEAYDEGQIIFQAKVDIEAADTPDTLASKIHQLEHQHYPAVIEQLLRQ